MNIRKVWKVWVEIEECDIDEKGDVVTSYGECNSLDIGSVGTYDSLEKANDVAREITEGDYYDTPGGQVD